ncbi:Astacin-like metalloprotease toxin 1 [Folsomia candida]|uniref:Metalloendopeptidase n=1 Tax=Folsomia candida TaxID=158441 RepID=A0A226EAC9_FOLCA|nr:Astacin-like metalloprotease toxin 1 [Folsomia candida]
MIHILVCGLPKSGTTSLKNLLELGNHDENQTVEEMQIGRIEETLANLNPSIPTCIIYTLRKGRVTSALDALSIKERQYLFNDKVPTILYISHCDNLSDNTWWKINSAFVQQFGIIPCREVIHGSIRTCSSNGWDPEPRTELMTAIQKNSGTEWIQEIQNEMRNRGTLLGRYSKEIVYGLILFSGIVLVFLLIYFGGSRSCLDFFTVSLAFVYLIALLNQLEVMFNKYLTVEISPSQIYVTIAILQHGISPPRGDYLREVFHSAVLHKRAATFPTPGDSFDFERCKMQPGLWKMSKMRSFWFPGARASYDGASQQHRPLVMAAMQQYQDFTCVKFVPRTTEVNYLYIEQGTAGCSTFVGNLRRGRQILQLGRGCLFIGTVVHELGHSIGFHHEHNRIDRDEYIDIIWENVQKAHFLGSERLFVKTPASQEWMINGYDINSIMHYGETAFSKDGISPTMKSKDGRPIYDPRGKPGLNWSDIYRINILYNC